MALGFDRTQVARGVNWVGYAFALVGGCATREAGLGDGINNWGIAHAAGAWIVTIVALVAAIYDLCDGVPNIFAMAVALTFPSMVQPLGKVGGDLGHVINIPFQLINDYLGAHLAGLIGQSAAQGGLGGLAFITWGTAIGCLVVHGIRNRKARGGATRSAPAATAPAARPAFQRTTK
jgi:hypothetical protein